MFCRECGSQLEENACFCSKCGAKIEAECESAKDEKVQTQPFNKPGNRNDEIIIKSENCITMLEEAKKAIARELNSLLLVVTGIGFLLVFGPYLVAVLEDKKLSQVGSPSLSLLLVTIVMFIAAFAYVSKLNKVFAELYSKYKGYCSVETLIVDKSKIYGVTTKGTLHLSYRQIESVRFRSNAWEKQIQRFFSSEIFTINDIAGNEFVFYSFNNCKDLKAIVEQQMRNVVGVSERED